MGKLDKLRENEENEMTRKYLSTALDLLVTYQDVVKNRIHDAMEKTKREYFTQRKNKIPSTKQKARKLKVPAEAEQHTDAPAPKDKMVEASKEHRRNVHAVQKQNPRTSAVARTRTVAPTPKAAPPSEEVHSRSANSSDSASDDK